MKSKQMIPILLFLAVLLSLTIGFVSAATVKYTDYCHGGDLNHKTTWEKKLSSKQYEGWVKKNGKYYKKYLNLYERSIKNCKHKSHKNIGNYPYSYATYGQGGKPTYSYKLIKNNQVVKTSTSKSYIGEKVVKRADGASVIWDCYKITKKTLYGNGKTKTTSSTTKILVGVY